MYQAQKLDCANCLAIGFVCVLKILVNMDKEKKIEIFIRDKTKHEKKNHPKE